MSNNGKLYFAGMSTDNEIRALFEQFGSANKGQIITHDQIEGIVGVRRDSHRYRTITGRFVREMLKSKNLELACQRNEGYRVLTDSERLGKAEKDTGKTHRAMKKIHYRIATIPRGQLTTEESRRADHAQVLVAKIVDDMGSARKQIAPPAPSQQNR